MKPEETQKLWAAVLEQAIKDGLSDNLYLRKGAREWFRSQDGEVGSFLWVCATLDINPEFLQKLFSEES